MGSPARPPTRLTGVPLRDRRFRASKLLAVLLVMVVSITGGIAIALFGGPGRGDL